MATLHKNKRQKLRNSPEPDYQQGGYSVDMFDGFYNLGTTRGRRKQRQLERLVRRANRGRRGAQRKLQELNNLQTIQQYQDQGYEISVGNPMTGSVMVTDPNSGQSFEVNPNVPSGWERFNQGISNFASTVVPGAVGALVPGAAPIIGAARSFLPTSSPFQGQTSQMPMAGGMFGGQNFGGMFGGLDQVASLMSQIASQEDTPQEGVGLSDMAFEIPQATAPIMGQTPFGTGFGTPFNPMGGGFQVPGFGGGMFGQQPGGGFGQVLSGLGSIANLAGSLGLFQGGGGVDSFLRREGLLPPEYRPVGVIPNPNPNFAFDVAGIPNPEERLNQPTPKYLKPPSNIIDELSVGLAAVESSHLENPYAARNNQTNALGKYQFIPTYHQEDVKDTTGIDISTEEGRVEFLNNPEAQEEYFREYAKETLLPQVKKMRKKHGKKLDDYTDVELMSILHYNWTGGVDKLASGEGTANPTEGTEIANVTYDTYLNRVRSGIDAASRSGVLTGDVGMSRRRGKKGGRVRKFQSGGLVDIQAEKGEFIYHPTGYVTPVHAKKSHKAMERSGDEDMITDHPLEGSFIFSDYLKINRSDADDLIVGVKRYPYEEGEKGKEPEVYSVGDLFRRKEKRKTPATLAKRVSNTFKVINDKEDIFNILGDQNNILNRKPYLDGIAMLSEIEREKDDALEMLDEMQDTILAKKGGKMKSRRVYRPIRSKMAQFGGPVQDFINDAIFEASRRGSFTPVDPLPPISGYDFAGRPDPTVNPLPGRRVPFVRRYPGVDPIPSRRVESVGMSPGFDSSFSDTVSQMTSFLPQGGFQQQGQQMGTQFVDQGSPFLRGLGQVAIPLGGAINFGSNVAGAIGSYNLNNQFINENRAFFEGQRGLTNQSRDIASAGNLFDVGLNFLQQGPVDQEERFSSRVRQFDPMRQVNVSRQLADQSVGQINSMIRNNPNLRGLNIGSAIAANNQSIAQATQNALNQQFEIDRFLDDEDFFNQGVRTGNQQRRVDFGNQLIQGARPGFQGFFRNESSRPLDILGLNSAERQADIAFRQNRLFQPIEFLSTAGNALTGLGSTALALGTNYQPVQVPVGGGQGGSNFGQIVSGVGSIANTLSNLGIFQRGGEVKKNR